MVRAINVVHTMPRLLYAHTAHYAHCPSTPIRNRRPRRRTACWRVSCAPTLASDSSSAPRRDSVDTLGMRKVAGALHSQSLTLTCVGFGLATGRGLVAPGARRADVARAGRGDASRNADGDSTLHEMERRRFSVNKRALTTLIFDL